MNSTPNTLDFAIELAKEAGQIMRSNFSLGMKKEWKEDNTPLTVTDEAINELVIQKVSATFPDHSVLGEENSSEVSGSTHVWVVDPVDGTIPFSHGVPTFVFSLALVINGQPQVGVIYDPILDRLLSAEKGKGAYLNGKLIQVGLQRDLKNTVVNIDGSWVSGGGEAIEVKELDGVIRNEGAKVTRLCCMAYGGMLVALGEYSAAICGGVYPWDVAALKIIVEEAGGKVTNLKGEEQQYHQPIYGAVISNQPLHEQLVQLLKPFVN